MDAISKWIRAACATALAVALMIAYATVEPVPVRASDGHCPADDEYCVDGTYGDPNQRYRCIGERCDTFNYACCLDEIIVH